MADLLSLATTTVSIRVTCPGYLIGLLQSNPQVYRLDGPSK